MLYREADIGGRKGGLLCRCNKAPLTKLMESDHFHPERKGVNDGIKADLYSLRYTSVEEAVRRNKSCMGHGTCFTKLYIEVAYRIVPVHPEDQHLLGMGWDGMGWIQHRRLASDQHQRFLTHCRMVFSGS